eukprot:TRINITY_DN32690_c0_g1_i2.p1 TRINITY_DN32690_c0_g1~~TRINITY_DN32690_c0_g1_i2.p1  ORF type:complete len:183 (+),score=29.86 TRINITY_DN32690_c0_g1_i2:138-686(+)
MTSISTDSFKVENFEAKLVLNGCRKRIKEDQLSIFKGDLPLVKLFYHHYNPSPHSVNPGVRTVVDDETTIGIDLKDADSGDVVISEQIEADQINAAIKEVREGFKGAMKSISVKSAQVEFMFRFSYNEEAGNEITMLGEAVKSAKGDNLQTTAFIQRIDTLKGDIANYEMLFTMARITLPSK